METLESRVMLSGQLWITGLTATGGAAHPFDRLEVQFSQAVQDGTFAANDLSFTGPGGAIAPSVVNKLSADRYEVVFTGLTNLSNYALTIGPDIQDTLGRSMDQDKDGVPGEAGQDAYNASLFSSSFSLAGNNASYDGQNMVLFGCNATVDGTHSFASLEVLGGAVLTHSSATAVQEFRLELLITNGLLIDATSRIDVTNRGYVSGRTLGNTATGGATGSAGGSYGGLGAEAGSNRPYGDANFPNELGSGGGTNWASAGAGGGLVQITAGTVVVNGAILANGGDGSPGGEAAGSGGGVLIRTGTLSGSGVIAADGGPGYDLGGSGSGGRVAIYTWASQGMDVSHITATGGEGGPVDGNDGTIRLHAGLTHAGTLTSNQNWSADSVHYITSDFTISNGITLTIDPGAVVKFADLAGINVQAGGFLNAQGLISQPITFTSDRDDSVGGDTNQDGSTTTAAAGDWRWIYVEGQADLNHVVVRYGGGTASGNWDGTGVIRTAGSAQVTISNSVIRDIFFDGVLAWGGSVNLLNTIITQVDRGVCVQAGSSVTVLNCTLDDNRIGLLVHGGLMDVLNTIVSNSIETGIQFDFGTLDSVRYTDVWSSAGSGSVNYAGIADPIGTDGNLSVDPKYRNAAGGDYHLGYLSGLIDAADGLLAPDRDLMGTPRYNDPRTPNTGIATSSGAFADLGALEFAETADSGADLAVTSVTGPSAATVGQNVTLQWTLTNLGTESIRGPWHDGMYVSMDGDDVSHSISLGDVLAGEGITLAPGESYTASGTVVLPSTFLGAGYWQVFTNVRGDVFEGKNTSNNVGSSAAPAEINYTSLPVDGSAVSGQFDHVGDWRWYVVNAVREGQNILVNLDLSGTGQTEMYVKFGAPPTRTDFDLRSANAQGGDQQVEIPSTHLGTYYVMVYCAGASTLPSTYALSASEPGFTLAGTTPQAGGNVGSVTLAIHGTNLNAQLLPQLISPTGAHVYGGHTYFVDPTLMYATFDLTGASLGKYDVLLQKPDGSYAVKADSFTVAQGQGAHLDAHLILPDAVRAGRTFSFQVEYANTGDTDMVSPILDLKGPAGMAMGLSLDEMNSVGSLSFMGYSTSGPAGILQPGDTEKITVYATAGTTSNRADFTLQGRIVDPRHPRIDAIDWAGLEAKYKPAFAAQADFDPMWDAFTATMGQTWDEVTAHLAQRVTRQVQLGQTPELIVDNLMQQIFADSAGGGGGLTDQTAPWVVTAQPILTKTGGLTGIDVIFSETIAPTSFTAGDVALTGPGGAAIPVTISRLSGNVYHLSFAGQPTAGRYGLTLSPAITDMVDLPLDQNRNGLGGEGDDGFTTAFIVPAKGKTADPLFVTNSWPAVNENLDARDGVSRAILTLSKPIRFMSLTPADVTMYAILGSGVSFPAPVAVTGITQLGPTTYQIDFVPQTSVGTYVVRVGSQWVGLDGKVLDQNTNGVAGEPADFFSWQFQLVDIHGPRVVSHTPNDFVDQAVSSVDIVFSEPIAAPTFTIDDLTITGPNGAITPLSIETISSTVYRVHFAPQSDAMHYSLTVGPNVTDMAGNAMDQNGDGNNGAAGDTYTGQFHILPGTPAPQPLAGADGPAGPLYSDPPTSDLVIIQGQVSLSGAWSKYFTSPHVMVQLWQQDGDRDAQPGVTSADGLADHLIAATNDRTGTGLVDASGRFVFTTDINGDPITNLDPDNADAQPEFYVVVYAYNGDAYVVDGDQTLTTDPDCAANPWFAPWQPNGMPPLSTDAPSWGRLHSYAMPGIVVPNATNPAGTGRQELTANVQVNDDIFGLSEWIHYAADWTRGAMGQAPRDQIAVVYPMGNPLNAYESDNLGIIAVGRDLLDMPGVVLHEYGHAIQFAANGYKPTPYSGGDYGILQEGPEDTAFAEAWASFFAARVLQNVDTWNNLGVDWSDNMSLYRLTKNRSGEYMTGNNFWMGYDGYGFTGNPSSTDTKIDAGYLLFSERALTGFDGVNNDANTTRNVLGGIESILWQLTDRFGLANVWASMGATAPASTLDAFYSVYPSSRAADAIFIDNGYPAGPCQDDAYEGTHDTQADPFDLGMLKTPKFLDGLIMAEADAGAGDWYHFGLPSTSDAKHDVVYSLTVDLRWAEKYGDLDLIVDEATSGLHEERIHYGGNSEIVTISGLHTSQTYDFTLGAFGHGAIMPDGSTYGGDYNPQYSLAINVNVPTPDEDDDGSVAGTPALGQAVPLANGGTDIEGSYDPNEKVGPVGYGRENFTPAGTQLPYTVYFENDPTKATAPVQEVRVTDTLDSDLDYSTFELKEIVFGDHVVAVPAGRSYYSTTIDLRPEQNLLVQIEAGINPTTGQAYWNLLSVDPTTGQLPEDPFAGFLPLDDSDHHGQGYVSFTVDSKDDLADETQIRNSATIVFDVNDPLDTNEVVNTIFTPYTHTITAGKNGKWTYPDANGNLVTVALGGKRGSVTVVRGVADGANGDIVYLQVDGTDAAGTLTLTPARGTNTNVDEILITGSLKSVTGKGVDLLGDLTVSGALASLTLDDAVSGSTISIGQPTAPAKTTLALTLDEAADLNVTSGEPIKSIKATEWRDTGAPDRVQAPSLGSLTTTGRKADLKKGILALAGDFAANLLLTDATLKATLGSAKIAGNLLSASWSIDGNMGALTVAKAVQGADAAHPVTISATGSMLGLTLGAALHADFLAGVTREPGRHATDASQLGAATIKSVKIAGWKVAKGADLPLFFLDANFSSAAMGAVSVFNGEFEAGLANFFALADPQGIKSFAYTDPVKTKAWTWKAGMTPIPDVIGLL